MFENSILKWVYEVIVIAEMTIKNIFKANINLSIFMWLLLSAYQILLIIKIDFILINLSPLKNFFSLILICPEAMRLGVEYFVYFYDHFCNMINRRKGNWFLFLRYSSDWLWVNITWECWLKVSLPQKLGYLWCSLGLEICISANPQMIVKLVVWETLSRVKENKSI